MKPNTRILVIGATGAQGGSVAKALLRDRKYRVRIFTRNKLSEKAIALQQAGAEVAEGDLNDPPSILKALEGCEAVFGVTDYKEHSMYEYRLGKNLVDAVAQSAIKHFVFSSQDSYSELSNGSLPVPSFDIKAALKKYIQQLQLPASFIQMSFYYENFLKEWAPMKNEEGAYFFGFPQGNTKLAAASVEDYGEVVKTVFQHPLEYIGRTVQVTGSDESCTVYAAVLSQILGRKITYQYIPKEQYSTLNFPGAAELANRFEVQRLYIPQRLVGLIESYALNPGMRHFRKWVIMNRRLFWAYFDRLDKDQAVA
jgi:uncharacterized protein YbjT (DUF2867 family)